MQLRMSVACAVALAGTTTSEAFSQDASFQGLGTVESWSRATGVAANGDNACAHGWAIPLRWSADGGFVPLPLPAGAERAWAVGMSGDGTTIVGYSVSKSGGVDAPLRWIGTAAPQILEWRIPGADQAGAHATSEDGTTSVGFVSVESGSPIGGTGRAARWVGTTLEQLDTANSAAACVSADGSTVMGWRWNRGLKAARWKDGAVAELFDGRAHGCSADGTVVVGETASGQAVRWCGVAVTIGPGVATGVSADGNVVVGYDNATAFIWTLEDGRRTVSAALAAEGIRVDPGWSLTRANAISADGTTVVGEGEHNGETEAWRAVLPRPFDSDGDGLPDDWETNGVPYLDADGVCQRYVLSGAHPQHKDIFVEVDAMQGMVTPSLSPVIDAFAAHDITLHAAFDETNLPHEAVLTDDGVLAVEFNAYRDHYFGTLAEHGEFGDENPEMRAARARAYRYCLFGDRIDIRLLGRADAFGGSNCIVLAGEAMTNPDICYDCTTPARHRLILSSFMHEFGHCLDLRHGGNDNVNYKLNYPSVMNYHFQSPFKFGSQHWALDYSAGLLPTIFEDDVDELTGFGHAAVNGRRTFHAENPCTTFDCEPNEVRIVTLGEYVIGSGAHDFDGDGETHGSVCTELNYFGPGSTFPHAGLPSPCDVMRDHDDWSNLQFAPAAGGTPLPGDPIVELTVDEIAMILDGTPDPCRGDVAPLYGDGRVGVEDLLLVLSSWGACEECAADLEPHTVADGAVDVQDLLVLLSNWGACR